MAQDAPEVFVSYSWDSEEHKHWVRRLSSRLRSHGGVEVILDQWHLAHGDEVTQFVERGIRTSDYVLIVCTPRYKERADQREGGVGAEGTIITGELHVGGSRRKFIPLLRAGTWSESAPTWLGSSYYADFNFSEQWEFDNAYHDLLLTFYGQTPTAPPVAPPPLLTPAVAKSKAKTDSSYRLRSESGQRTVSYRDEKTGEERALQPRWDLFGPHHEGEPFSWGYAGSGPHRLAFSMLTHRYGDDYATIGNARKVVNKLLVYIRGHESTIIYGGDLDEAVSGRRETTKS